MPVQQRFQLGSVSFGNLIRSAPFAHKPQQRPPATHVVSRRKASLLIKRGLCVLEGVPDSVCLDDEDMEAAEECSQVLAILK